VKRLNFNFRTMDQRQHAFTAAMVGIITGLTLTNPAKLLPLFLIAAALAASLVAIVAASYWIGSGDSE
jgi:hypothetical protein